MDREKLEYLVGERRAIDEELALIKNGLKEVNDQIMDELEGVDGSVPVEGAKVKVVRPGPKTVINWEKLKSTLSDEQWDSITMEVPSPELLDQAVASGKISLSTVSQATDEKPGASPHVKVTMHK